VGEISFTLTLYGIAENVEVRHVDGKYVRADSVVPNRRSRSWAHSWTTTLDMPSGRPALRACAADWRAKWEMHWREKKMGELPSRFRTIRRDLKAAVPVIEARIQEAEKQAAIERQRWEAESRERRRRERRERGGEAPKDQRQGAR